MKKEIVEGVVVTLTADGQTRTTRTNGWGDFWFEDLPEGTYSLEIQAAGLPGKSFSGLSTVGQSVNLGDIALS